MIKCMDLDDPYLPKGDTRYIYLRSVLSHALLLHAIYEGREAVIQQGT